MNSVYKTIIYTYLLINVQWTLFITTFLITAKFVICQFGLHENQQIVYFFIDIIMLFFRKMYVLCIC